jgi:hypothetical protein
MLLIEAYRLIERTSTGSSASKSIASNADGRYISDQMEPIPQVSALGAYETQKAAWLASIRRCRFVLASLLAMFLVVLSYRTR